MKLYMYTPKREEPIRQEKAIVEVGDYVLLYKKKLFDYINKDNEIGDNDYMAGLVTYIYENGDFRVFIYPYSWYADNDCLVRILVKGR